MENYFCVSLPAFEDNYIHILVNRQKSACLVIDPGTSDPVIDFIESWSAREASSGGPLQLNGVLMTHQHSDHIEGALGLKAVYNCPLFAPQGHRAQIPFADSYVSEGTVVELNGFNLKTWEIPGHTLGHVGFWEPNRKWFFCGDTLFGLGCGRLFEGTPEMMFRSLGRIRELPENTLLFCAHEYTEANLKFSMDQNSGLDYEFLATWIQKRRGAGLPTVPTTIEREKQFNLFIRANSVEEFARLRAARNQFKDLVSV